MSTNHQITLDRVTAESVSYCQCIHRPSAEDPADTWELGGWYRNSYRQTPEGWRFTIVRLEAVWENGDGTKIADTH